MPLDTSSPPRLGYVILYVPHVGNAVEFYERAFGLVRKFIHESGQYAELETGATVLAFSDETDVPPRESIEPNRAHKKAAAVEIALTVQDVATAFARAVAAGAHPVVHPLEKPWGQTISYVRDSNGVLVELCSVVSV
jgi:lactoylglutathione lyase